MNRNITNIITIQENLLNHLIILKKRGENIVKGVSSFDLDINNLKSLDTNLSEISRYIGDNNLTSILLITNNILKTIITLDLRESEGNIRGEVLNRFKSTFDVNLGDYYIDFEVYDSNEKKIIFVAGVPKEFLDNILKIFVTHKFKLLYMETAVNSLKRMLSFSKEDSIIMNIHMRFDSSIFIVAGNGTIYTFREIHFGFEDVLNNISENSGISIEEIKSKIYTKDFNYEDYPLSASIDRLILEIQRTIDFYNNQYRNFPIAKFVLTGQAANINSFDKLLSQIFAIESLKFDILKSVIFEVDPVEVDSIPYIRESISVGLRDYE